MNTKLLRQKILDLAIRGKLTEQKKSDGTTKDLLRQLSSPAPTGDLAASSVKKKNAKSKNLAKEIIPLDKSEAPFEIPENWEWVKLGDVASDFQYGSSEKSLPEGKIPVLRMGNINRMGQVVYDDLVYTSTDSEIEKYSLEVGDVLFNRTNSPEWVGKTALYKGEMPAIYAGYIIRIKPKFSSEYLNYLMCSKYERDWAYAVKTDGVHQSNINAQKLMAFAVPLPPLAEQQRIVETIENAFAEITTIENNQELLKKHIKQGRQKILDLAIRGKLTPQLKTDGTTKDLLATIGSESSACHAELDSASAVPTACHSERSAKGTKSKNLGKSPKDISKEIIPLDKSEAPFEIPSTWEWVRLGDIVKQMTDFTASGSFASLRENVKYYKEENYALLVRTTDFRYGFQRDLTYTDQHGYEFLSNSNLFGGELILSNIGASIGKVFVVPKLNCRMTLAPNSIMIRHYDTAQRDWLYYFFLSPAGQQTLFSISSSTAQAKFNKTELKSVSIPLPPLAEQQRIVATIQESFAEFDAMDNA